MTMFDFMVNAFYMFCGIACIAASVMLIYSVLNAFFGGIAHKKSTERRGGNGRHQNQ